MWSRVCIFVLFTCGLVFGQATETDYLNTRNTNIAAEGLALRGKPRPKLLYGFGAHMLALQGTVIQVDPSMNNPTLWNAYTLALKNLGAVQVQVNLWGRPYDDTGDSTARTNIATWATYAKSLGLRIVLAPTYTTDMRCTAGVATWADFQTCAQAAWVRMATDIQPERFTLLHEPSAMNSKLGFDGATNGTPAQYKSFYDTVGAAVKAASPSTKIGFAVLNGESSWLNQVVTSAQLDAVGLDIYTDAAFATFNSMITTATGAGKTVFVSESWRPVWTNPAGGNEASPAMYGCGNRDWVNIDRAWMGMIAWYASYKGMTDVNFFWTFPFFSQVVNTTTGSNADNCLAAQYHTTFNTDLTAGKVTETGTAFQELNTWPSVIID